MKFKRYWLATIPLVFMCLVFVIRYWQHYSIPQITLDLQADKVTPLQAKVIEIIDAQTLLISIFDKQSYCFVLNGLNTPLRDQAGYKRSVLGLLELTQSNFPPQINFTIEEILNTRVLIGSVYTAAEPFFGNLALIRYGFAWPDTYISTDADLRKQFASQARLALNNAKENTRGHWVNLHLNEPRRAPTQSYLKLLQQNGHTEPRCQP